MVTASVSHSVGALPIDWFALTCGSPVFASCHNSGNALFLVGERWYPSAHGLIQGTVSNRETFTFYSPNQTPVLWLASVLFAADG